MAKAAWWWSPQAVSAMPFLAWPTAAAILLTPVAALAVVEDCAPWLQSCWKAYIIEEAAVMISWITAPAGAGHGGDGSAGSIVLHREADERLQLLHLVPEQGQVVEQRVAVRVGRIGRRRLHEPAATAVHAIESMVEQLVVVVVVVVVLKEVGVAVPPSSDPIMLASFLLLSRSEAY
jgi:hypothetical protein